MLTFAVDMGRHHATDTIAGQRSMTGGGTHHTAPDTASRVTGGVASARGPRGVPIIFTCSGMRQASDRVAQRLALSPFGAPREPQLRSWDAPEARRLPDRTSRCANGVSFSTL